MGEIAEMMLDGTMDPETGEFNFDGEDGPGFPMTGAEAAEWKGETIRHGSRRGITGLWREIMTAIIGGYNRTTDIVDTVETRRNSRTRAKALITAQCERMDGVGLIKLERGRWYLTEKGRDQYDAGQDQA